MNQQLQHVDESSRALAQLQPRCGRVAYRSYALYLTRRFYSSVDSGNAAALRADERSCRKSFRQRDLSH